jgi:hypothetical protein
MTVDPEQRNPALPESSSEMIRQYVQTQEVDIKNLLPSQFETGIKLDERQETTRSQLATFLIKILAGTLTASFGLVVLLTIMTGFVDKDRAEVIKGNSSLVKDLVTFMLTAQTGLIGTALGFYFGSRNGNSD